MVDRFAPCPPLIRFIVVYSSAASECSEEYARLARARRECRARNTRATNGKKPWRSGRKRREEEEAGSSDGHNTFESLFRTHRDVRSIVLWGGGPYCYGAASVLLKY